MDDDEHDADADAWLFDTSREGAGAGSERRPR